MLFCPVFTLGGNLAKVNFRDVLFQVCCWLLTVYAAGVWAWVFVDGTSAELKIFKQA